MQKPKPGYHVLTLLDVFEDLTTKTIFTDGKFSGGISKYINKLVKGLPLVGVNMAITSARFGLQELEYTDDSGRGVRLGCLGSTGTRASSLQAIIFEFNPELIIKMIWELYCPECKGQCALLNLEGTIGHE